MENSELDNVTDNSQEQSKVSDRDGLRQEESSPKISTKESEVMDTKGDCASSSLREISARTEAEVLQGDKSSLTEIGSEILSKRQRKKLKRKQEWLETKVERKRREKEKLRQRLKAKREAGESCGNIRKRLKEVTMAASACKQRVVVDMSFDDLMSEKDLSKCVKQVSRCYSANRRVTDPMQLYVSSFEGKCKSLMARQNGYENWDVYFKSEYFMDIFSKEEVVYLTSESNNVLSTLDESKVYVIGGLVDHNTQKGLCYTQALEKGISHAKLPIDDFIEMKTRKVLTVDQVYRIVLGVSHGKSWKESFLDIIPARKGAMAKDSSETEGKDSDQDCEDTRDAQYSCEQTVENGKILEESKKTLER